MEAEDKKYLKVIGLCAAGLFAALAAVIFVYNSFIWPYTPLGDKAGIWEGHVYINTALKLRVEVPENWTLLDTEEALEWAAAELGETEDAPEGIKYLVSAGDMTTGTSLNLAAERGKMPSQKAIEASLEQGAQAMSRGTAYQIKQVEDMTTAGYVWRTYYVDYPELGAEAYCLVREFDGYTVTLGVIGFYKNDPISFLSGVTALEN